jgi:hypothetical protein
MKLYSLLTNRFHFNFIKAVLLLAFSTLYAAQSYAAENIELSKLIESLRFEKAIKTATIDINKYQLEKRIEALSSSGSSVTNEKKEQRIQVLNETAAVVEDLLSWKKIEQPIIEIFEKELSKEEIATLTKFTQTAAGQYYVNEFQFAAAPMAIALDKFIDKLVDQLFDEPDKPLPLVLAIDANEMLASRLLIKLSPKDAVATFEKKRAPFITMMTPSTKTNNKKEVEQNKKLMLDFNKAYSYEQINWRNAQVLSKQMNATHIAELITAVENPALRTALLKFSAASLKINELITKQVMSSTEFTTLLKKL